MSDSPSLTIRAVEIMLSSNYFFSSKCVERKINDGDTMQESFQKSGIDLFHRRYVPSSLLKDSLRALNRVTAFVIIGRLIAPISCAKNSISLYYQIFRSKIKKEKLNGNKTIPLINSIVFDCVITVVTVVPLTAGMNMFAMGVTISGLAHLALGVIPVLAAIDPINKMTLLLVKEDRIAFAKAIIFKLNFGIVTKKGRLLNYHFIADGERYYNKVGAGFLFDLSRSKARILLKQLKILQDQLPADIKVDHIYPPKADQIFKHLNAHKNRITLNLNEWEQKLKEIENELNELNSLLRLCVSLEERSFFKKKCPPNIPVFPFTADEATKIFHAKEVDPKWDSFLDSIIPHLSAKTEGFSEHFETYRNRVKRKLDPHQIFDLKSNFTLDELNSAYRKANMATHPDKNGNSNEAKALNQAINHARDNLKKKIGK